MISFFFFFFIEKIPKPKEVSVKVLIFGGQVVLHRPGHLTGMRRVFEISKEMGFNLATDARSSVNVDGRMPKGFYFCTSVSPRVWRPPAEIDCPSIVLRQGEYCLSCSRVANISPDHPTIDSRCCRKLPGHVLSCNSAF